VDPDDYHFQKTKHDYLLFLAKASWRVKNVKGAIRIARRAKKKLRIVGGSSWPRSWRGAVWEGMLGGSEKSALIAAASGLLFPVLWHEPFGLAVVESLVSGTPVLGSPFGSLPELIAPDVGRICSTEKEFVDAVPSLGGFKPEVCRDFALARFHYRVMCEKYLHYYSEILNGRELNPNPPRAVGKAGELLRFCRQSESVES
jgi:glycosyltransferase involved in cell wall biosynthesis